MALSCVIDLSDYTCRYQQYVDYRMSAKYPKFKILFSKFSNYH